VGLTLRIRSVAGDLRTPVNAFFFGALRRFDAAARLTVLRFGLPRVEVFFLAAMGRSDDLC
jgi:hypothetical protein